MSAMPISCISAGRLMPARTISHAKVLSEPMWVWRSGRQWYGDDDGTGSVIQPQSCVRRARALSRRRTGRQSRDWDVPGADSDRSVVWFPGPREDAQLLPLPGTRSCASDSNTSSRFNAMTSAERRPCRSISPTIARSRALRKLRQEARHFHRPTAAGCCASVPSRASCSSTPGTAQSHGLALH